jgi:hypothetical protein
MPSPPLSSPPLLPRLHLLELEDQGWLPVTLRELATDYLCAIESRIGLAEVVAGKLEVLCQRAGQARCVDLGSGSGGVWPEILATLADSVPDLTVTLTDRFPNSTRWQALAAETEGRLSFVGDSVDARHPPPGLDGIRTLCNVLHHFDPAEVGELLAENTREGQPLAAFEVVDRRLVNVLGILLVPLAVWLMTPAMRPFRWARLFWTYLVPLVPALVLWDGLVSQLRAYTRPELEAIAAEAVPGYTWECGARKVGPLAVPITWLIGRPSTTWLPLIERPDSSRALVASGE